jgi:hypothetical protein
VPTASDYDSGCDKKEHRDRIIAGRVGHQNPFTCVLLGACNDLTTNPHQVRELQAYHGMLRVEVCRVSRAKFSAVVLTISMSRVTNVQTCIAPLKGACITSTQDHDLS